MTDGYSHDDEGNHTLPFMGSTGGETMNDEQVERMKQAIHVYSTWLGRWGVKDLSSNDREFFEGEFYGEYGYRELLFDSGTRGYYRVMGFEVSYGDDGGNSELTCLFERGDNTLVFMLQEFDTRVQPIYDFTYGLEPTYLNVPEEV